MTITITITIHDPNDPDITADDVSAVLSALPPTDAAEPSPESPRSPLDEPCGSCGAARGVWCRPDTGTPPTPLWVHTLRGGR